MSLLGIPLIILSLGLVGGVMSYFYNKYKRSLKHPFLHYLCAGLASSILIPSFIYLVFPTLLENIFTDNYEEYKYIIIISLMVSAAVFPFEIIDALKKKMKNNLSIGSDETNENTKKEDKIKEKQFEENKPGEVMSTDTKQVIIDVPSEKNKNLDKLLKDSKELYSKGKINDALRLIKIAYELEPFNTDVIKLYSTTLFRFRDTDKVKSILAKYEESVNMRDYNILITKGELHLREKEYDSSIQILKTIEDRKQYNVEYLMGMCYVYKYQNQKNIADLASALKFLRSASEHHSTHWWVKLNLAIVYKLMNNRNTEVEKEAIQLIQEKIDKDVMKVSARIYRLYYYILIDNVDEITRAIKSDEHHLSKILELPSDFIESMGYRIELIHLDDPEKQKLYKDKLIKWVSSFNVLS